MKRLAILGATGSIGMQALEVAAAQEDLQVVALAAGSDVAGLVAAARATGAEHVALADPAAAAKAAGEENIRFLGNFRTNSVANRSPSVPAFVALSSE